MKLETERLILREMTMDDLDALCRVFCDPAVSAHYPYDFDRERAEQWIRRNMKRYEIFGFGLWAVCLKESGEVIGDCGLTMQMIGNVIRPEIGYHIRRDMQRKGYACEAACAVRDMAFETMPLNMIFSYMKYTNTASMKTAEAYGCRFTEKFEDDVNEYTCVYAITREQWKKLKEEEQL